MKTSIKRAAQQFGTALDNDDFVLAASVVGENCTYEIGDKTLIGPKEILGLYEENMKAGRKKFDELEWGKCRIEVLNESQAAVHFEDFLKHRGIEHIYKCFQILTFNESEKIIKIEHQEYPNEREQFDLFLKKVGLS